MEIVNEKQKQAGRPLKQIKREVRACVRFSNYEYFIIKEKSDQAGVKVSEFIRQTAITSKIIQRLTSEEVHYVRQLIGMSGNLNQVAKVCNRDGLYEAMQYFENYRNLIDTVILKLKQ